MALGQRFRVERAVETILYVVSRGEEATLQRVFKVLYLADKHQLASCQSLVTADSYTAMSCGPVPDSIDALVRAVRDAADHEPARLAGAAFTVKGEFRTLPQRPACIEHLSKAAVRSLDYAVDRFGSMPLEQLTELSRGNASWPRNRQGCCHFVGELGN